MSIQWLRANFPGFGDLSEKECDAVTNFSLLWMVFESKILNMDGNATSITNAVDAWSNAGLLSENDYDDALAYFRKRYFAEGDFTHHFDNLHLKNNDITRLVRSVLDGTNNVPRDRVLAILIIIYRYRNNLFHGVKWQYQLKDQFDNFNHANRVLMQILAHHGNLA
jgi:hypothetical protein